MAAPTRPASSASAAWGTCPDAAQAALRVPRRACWRSALIAALILLAFTKFNPFSNPYELHAGFNDARNIGVGSPVRIAGVEVGRVSRLEANGEGAATVTMELRDDALPIHRDATLKIRPRILLEGNYFVDVRPGTPDSPVLDDGSTVPATQTATAVSLPEVLATLTTDTRDDLQTLLYEYGTVGLGNGGAEAVNRSIPYFAPAYRRTAITNDALLGLQPNRDLRRLLRGTARTFGALASRPEQLKDLVTDLSSVAGALASQDSALAESVPALDDTLRVGYPALADVDAALPALRRVLHRGAPRRALDRADARGGDPVDRAGSARSCSRRSCAGWRPTCAERFRGS